MLAVASFSLGDCIKSVALLVKKSPSVWSWHLGSADLTIAVLYSKAFPILPSDRCGVYRSRCSSHHWHQSKGPHHSSSDVLTLAAVKSRISQIVSPDAPHSHQPATCLNGPEGWTHCNIFVVVWPPVCQSPAVPAVKTKFSERAFSYVGPAAWNRLPAYIQCESNTKHFKKLLKTYLFTSSF